MSTHKYHAFLSHKSSDKEALRELKRRLLDLGLSAWLDEDEVKPGDRLLACLKEGMDSSRAFIACIGKEGQGPWQDLEIEAALIEAVKKKKPVIPLLLPGVTAQPELPFFLASFGYVNFSTGWDAAELERLKWGITGVKPVGATTSAVAVEALNPVDGKSDASGEDEATRIKKLQTGLAKVFGSTLQRLEQAVAPKSALRDLLVRTFQPVSKSEKGIALELLYRFHVGFLPVIGAFAQMHEEESNPKKKRALVNLMGSVMYLAMDPRYAEQLAEGGVDLAARLTPIAEAAGESICSILLSWIQRRAEVRALDQGKVGGGGLDGPPHMRYQLMRSSWLERYKIPDSPNADALLDRKIFVSQSFGKPEAVFLDECEKELLAEIRKDGSGLRRLAVFVRQKGASIRPGSVETDFDGHCEEHLQALRDELSN
jgi:hypothetical protein